MKRTTCWTRAVLAATFLLAAAPVSAAEPESPAAFGPDVTVFSLTDINNYGEDGGYQGYSIGTRSCNRGDTNLNWCDQGSGCAPGVGTNEHPVIAQNLFRLYDGRFDQIGMSWLKHGFTSTNSTTAGCTGVSGQTCTGDGTYGGNQLTVGCTDPYGAGLNGSRPLGMRSEVNAATGAYPFPYTEEPASEVYEQRVKVDTELLEPTANPGALYWVEAQYVAPDDAAAGRGLNNASYRRVTVGSSPYNLTFAAATVEGLPAIFAWQAQDPSVEVDAVDVPSSLPTQRFHVAQKVTDLGGGTLHYEYAIRNMNSDRSARAFAIDFPDGTTLSNAGFKDIEHHSGEPYSTTDWTMNIDAPTSVISWSTETFATNPNANALRWGTMFNFWFDVARQPGAVNHTITLFKPGSPASVSFVIDLFSDGFESGGTGGWDSAGS